MYSIKFPDMFSYSKTNLIKDNEATLSNTKLLIGAWKNSLYGDPFFGTNVKQYVYEQNNVILRDIIIDDLFESIRMFIPQILVKREWIKITQENQALYATINCINKLDNQPDMFTIRLLRENENEY